MTILSSLKNTLTSQSIAELNGAIKQGPAINDCLVDMENLCSLYNEINAREHVSDFDSTVYIERMEQLKDREVEYKIYELTWILNSCPRRDHADRALRKISHDDFGRVSFCNIKIASEKINRNSTKEIKIQALRLAALLLITKNILPHFDLQLKDKSSLSHPLKETIQHLNDCFRQMELPICLPLSFKSAIDKANLELSIEDINKDLIVKMQELNIDHTELHQSSDTSFVRPLYNGARDIQTLTIPEKRKINLEELKASLTELKSKITEKHPELDSVLNDLIIFRELHALVSSYDMVSEEQVQFVDRHIQGLAWKLNEYNRNALFHQLWEVRGKILSGPLNHPEFGRKAFLASKTDKYKSESIDKQEAIKLVCESIERSVFLPLYVDKTLETKDIEPFTKFILTHVDDTEISPEVQIELSVNQDFQLAEDSWTVIQEKISMLIQKYPNIGYELLEPQSQIFHSLESLRLYFSLGSQQSPELVEKIDFIRSFCDELLDGDYTRKDAIYLLEKALGKMEVKPSQKRLIEEISLRQLKTATENFIQANAFNKPSSKTTFKPIFEIDSSSLITLNHYPEEIKDSTKAKFKPISDLRCLISEKVCLAYDRITCTNMTQPSLQYRSKALVDSINTIIALYNSRNPEKIKNAKIRISNLPGQYKELLALKLNFPVEASGYIHLSNFSKSLHKDTHHSQFSKEMMIRALEETKEHCCGTIQSWILNKDIDPKFNLSIERAYDLQQKFENCAKINDMAHSLAHLHMLSGIIKGSTDNSSGNTMFILTADETEIVDIKEFDDEFSSPEENDYRNMRLWQMGLPAANQPFSKATIMLFLQGNWDTQIEKYNVTILKSLEEKIKHREKSHLSTSHLTTLHISYSKAFEAQKNRILSLKEKFQEQLAQATVTLTPRELFFTVFGGMEEFQSTKQLGFSALDFFDIFPNHRTGPDRSINPKETPRSRNTNDGAGRQQHFLTMECSDT